jgi:predicted nucleic acid-binding Zn ribbon protein
MTWRPARDEEVPTGVGTSLEALLKRLGGGSVKTTKDVFEAWGEAVGPEVSSHANPVSLVDGVLHVEVDDARWLTQLKWLGGRVADRLNEACGKDAVERLNMRLTRPKSTS